MIITIFILSTLLGITSVSLLFAAKKLSESKKAEQDQDKYILFSTEMVIAITVDESLKNTIISNLKKLRTYELKELVLNNLKDFPYEINHSNIHEVDNTEIEAKINDMLMNFDRYVDNYFSSKCFK